MPPAPPPPRPDPPSPADPAAPATTRLYISPLDAERLSIILPASQRHLAASVTYHAPATFPEKAYGYISLPADEAQRLRRKLHGSFLKGVKMRVEEARPEKRRAGADDDLVADKVERRSKRKRSAKAEEDGVLAGVELPDGRKVKRGWTDGDGNNKKKAKAGGDAQLVFRASLPPNVASKTVEGEAAASKSQGKKSKRGGKNGTKSEVKEFDKTSKFPTFLRESSSGTAAKKTKDFVDGKGWVDEDGNLLEAVKESRHPSVAPLPSVEAGNEQSGAVEGDGSSVTSSDESDDSPSDDDDREATPRPGASVAEQMTPEITTTAPEEDAKKPSVLESLFKRPAASASSNTRKAKPAPVETGFGFNFDNNEAADEETDEATVAEGLGERRKKPGALMIPPQTPFTRRDLDARGMRSAAPTPDTAAIGRRSRPPWSGRDSRSLSTGRDTPDSVLSLGVADGANGLDASDATGTKEALDTEDEVSASKDEEGQTEFEKQFYEQRGAYNRSWRTGKRLARKEARQTENRKGLRGKA